MKRIHIVGAGPAGCYFALLMQKVEPGVEITIWEAYPAEVSHGWGIVLTQGVHDVLKRCDRETGEAIEAVSSSWRDLHVYHRGEKTALRVFPYISLSRVGLIRILRDACARRGIRVHYEHRLESIDDVRDCDLLIGADGARSLVRESLAQQFEPHVATRNNRYIWLGSSRVFNAFTMMFRRHKNAVFAAEGYRFADDASTFIAQCTDETWRAAGLDRMSLDESCKLIAEIFAEELDGHAVVANDSSAWRQFPIVSNANWCGENAMLLGDALHTAHFSTGSGTRLALEDAIAAARAFETAASTQAAMLAFERQRKPAIERFQDTAFNSLRWYEDIERVFDLETIPFVFSALTRSQRVDLRILRIQDPAFARQYVAWRDAQPPGAAQ